MSTAPETSTAYARLARSPIARVLALSVALGVGFASLSLAVPALAPRAEDATALAEPSKEGKPTVAVPSADAASVTTETTAKAMQNLVTALASDEEIADDGRSRLPRPVASSRLYRGPVDDRSTMTVYAAPGGPADVLAGYTKVLEGQGFTFEDRSPDRVAKPMRIFTKGDLEAIVTVGSGSSGALLTVIEGPRRAKS
jgi:hypothetical protein